MSVKSQLCNIVRVLKSEQGLTYDEILLKCRGGLHKSQLTNIIKNDGFGVSVDLIEWVIKSLGGELEVHLLVGMY